MEKRKKTDASNPIKETKEPERLETHQRDHRETIKRTIRKSSRKSKKVHNPKAEMDKIYI
jgi:hypothetical protein